MFARWIAYEYMIWSDCYIVMWLNCACAVCSEQAKEIMERWQGKVALITGASTGIGYVLAKQLTEFGMNVVGCARNTATIEVRTTYKNIWINLITLVFNILSMSSATLHIQCHCNVGVLLPHTHTQGVKQLLLSVVGCQHENCQISTFRHLSNLYAQWISQNCMLY